MAATVRRSAEGSHSFSSPPKALLKPIFPHQRSQKRQHEDTVSSSFGGTSLYNRASSRSTPYTDRSKRSSLYSPHGSSGKHRRGAKHEKGDQCGGDSPFVIPPVSGRRHIPVQTDLYLEELCDIIEESDAQCQTDPLLDRPASPLFVPAKIGVDVETQIYEGELFDFDREVEPILEAMVGQTLELSLIEVMEEEELATLVDMQKKFEERRHAELAERQRLEEQERRLLEERQKRLKEQEEAIKLEEETAQKVAACVFAQNYLSDLMPQVFNKLEEYGYIHSLDPVSQELEESFWPWLMDEVDREVNALENSFKLVDSLIVDAMINVKDHAALRPVSRDIIDNKYKAPLIEDEPVIEETSDESGSEGQG